MKQRLAQEQTLQWKMNQSLIQSIQILRFSSIELLEHIQQISKENPLIEEIDYGFEISQYKIAHANQPAIGEINPTQISMYEQLRRQLFTLNIPQEIIPVVHFGIDSLRETGYLDIELVDWAAQCNTSLTVVEEALTFIQALDPPGIGARNLSECIELQLQAMECNYPFVNDLLKNHLEWIAEENVRSIAEYYHVDDEEVSHLLSNMKTCHPEPGKLLVNEEPEYIIPEATIFKEHGRWRVTFYKWNTPHITINQEYTQLLNQETEAAAYIKDKYKQIEQLRQAIRYRTSTLEQIIQKIIEKQYLFFEHGAFMLQPLTMKEIANALNISISTVSRAVNNKYVQTTVGVIPLKFFFHSGVKNHEGKAASAFAIKQLIAEMIAHEDKLKPLSDERIKNKLAEEFDIHIARRTVMKYREQLNIPASTKRK